MSWSDCNSIWPSPERNDFLNVSVLSGKISMRSTSSFVFKSIVGLHGSDGDQTSPPTLYGRADDNTDGGQVNFIVVRSTAFRRKRSMSLNGPAAGASA